MFSKLRSAEYGSLKTAREYLARPGLQVHVSLVDKKGRKKRSNASADNWSPESGEIHIYFEPEANQPNASAANLAQPSASGATLKSNGAGPRIADLVRALDRAESRPGYGFVALKWFRDTVLTTEGFDWTQSESERQTAIREAIDKRIILTDKVHNPKSPQFPVTSIRLNRLLPDVLSILGHKRVSASDFDPQDIRGEALSATVLRQRR